MRFARIGAGTAAWGDALDPSKTLIERGNIDYLESDMLAELTLAIHQRYRKRDPNSGYVRDIYPFFQLVLKTAFEKGIRITCNGGAANPLAAGEVIANIARELGINGLKIGVVTGDDILHRIDEIRAKGWKFTNLDTGEEDIGRIQNKIIAANAYIGADQIIEAFKRGCQVVVGGRFSDNALIVGPLMYHFGWDYGDPYVDLIGKAIIVGHLIECTGCCTGCLCSTWKDLPEPWKIGYPIAEVYENGDAVITKCSDTGGRVDKWTLKDQLVYEVHDPSNYIMPDGVADFTTIKLEEIGPDQVKVTGGKGKPRPDNLKVCIGFEDGFITENVIYVGWPDAWEKAQRLAEVTRRRAQNVYQLNAEEFLIDFIGIDTLAGPSSPPPDKDINEIGVRIAVKTTDQVEAAKVRSLGADMAMGHGVCGTCFHTPLGTRPVVSLWPCLVPREEVSTQLVIITS